MNAQKVRMLLVVALLSVMMVAGNVFPAAAKVAPPPGCTYHGTFYPMGTVLAVSIGSETDYMRCEWRLTPGPGGLTPQWVVYDNYPS